MARKVIKISGEFLSSDKSAICPEKLSSLALQLERLKDHTSIVVGGGNIWRKRDWENIVSLSGTVQDRVGMQATVINAYALHGALNKVNAKSKVVNNLKSNVYRESYVFDEDVAQSLFNDYKILIFAGGTSLPYFSTDTTTVITALKTNSTAIYMCKNNVDGVYSKDPLVHKDAKFYQTISFKEYLHQGLTIIDPTAISLCLDRNIKIYVFSINKHGIILDENKGIFTTIHN